MGAVGRELIRGLGRLSRAEHFDPDHLDRTAGACLLGVIVGLEHAFQLQPLIVADPVLERVGGNGIGCTQVRRRKSTLAIEIRGHLIHVAPNLGFVGRSASVKDPHHFP